MAGWKGERLGAGIEIVCTPILNILTSLLDSLLELIKRVTSYRSI